jgi:hypothetical protein
MSFNDRDVRPARRTARRRQWAAAVAALAVVVAAIAAVLAHEPTAAAPPTAGAPPRASASASPDAAAHAAQARGAGAGVPRGAPPGGDEPRDRARGETDDAGTHSVTVSADVPTVTKLDPALRAALQRASTAAARAGIDVLVTSGWRSADLQQRLLDDAVAQYGSVHEAEKWVATPRTSAHVSGDAVDLGPAAATTWMSQHGASFGLCQVYANEPWHYELRPDAPAGGCPTMYADPTQDPRMQQ